MHPQVPEQRWADRWRQLATGILTTAFLAAVPVLAFAYLGSDVPKSLARHATDPGAAPAPAAEEILAGNWQDTGGKQAGKDRDKDDRDRDRDDRDKDHVKKHKKKHHKTEAEEEEEEDEEHEHHDRDRDHDRDHDRDRDRDRDHGKHHGDHD